MVRHQYSFRPRLGYIQVGRVPPADGMNTDAFLISPPRFSYLWLVQLLVCPVHCVQMTTVGSLFIMPIVVLANLEKTR